MNRPIKLAASLAALACSGIVLAQQPGYHPGYDQGMAPPPQAWDGGYGPGYAHPGAQRMPMGHMGGPMGGPMGMGPGYGPGHGQGPRMGGDRMPCEAGAGGMHRQGKGQHAQAAGKGMPSQDFHDARMLQMKESLGISEEQDEAWESYQSTMDKLHQEMQAFMDKMHEERAKTENPYAIQAKMWDFRKQHHESMSKARHELMKKLTPEQAENMGSMHSGPGPR